MSSPEACLKAYLEAADHAEIYIPHGYPEQTVGPYWATAGRVVDARREPIPAHVAVAGLLTRLRDPAGTALALSPLVIDYIAQQLLACGCATLTETAGEVDGLPGCPCVACVVRGRPTSDNCTSDCSQDPAADTWRANSLARRRMTVRFARRIVARTTGPSRRSASGTRAQAYVNDT